ncbi:ATP-binding protein [Streptomyces armeniacus]|uniref:ATP-binding protein n=2 Tax=Streptomyces armeniacus TaxID=83291 RepID=A0A345XMY2_9ACTN|nr:ATP-binding protein [Streptomyces armeniacus]
MQFTSTPRGARLARHLVAQRLCEWGYPYDSPPNETLALITAELSANAVRHGRVRGRDFRVRLIGSGVRGGETLRVEVADTRTEGVLPAVGEIPEAPRLDGESGRGLYLVAQLADRWGSVAREGAPGKDVWAELRVERPSFT